MTTMLILFAALVIGGVLLLAVVIVGAIVVYRLAVRREESLVDQTPAPAPAPAPAPTAPAPAPTAPAPAPAPAPALPAPAPASPAPAPAPAPKPVNPLLKRLRHAVDVHDDEQLAEVFGEFFEGVADLMEKPKSVLDDPYELRGWLGKTPARLEVDFEGNFHVEATIDNKEWVAFQYDETLAPMVGDPDDPFSADDDIRVFVAKGMYIQADQEAVDRAMRFVAGFSSDVLERIRAALVEGYVSKVQYGMEELFLYGATPLNELEDPVGACRDALGLVSFLSERLGGDHGGVLKQDQCTYCSSRFFFGIQQPCCPNCGATPGA